MRHMLMQRPFFSIANLLGLPLLFAWMMASFAFADDPQGLSDGQIIERAKIDWESGAFTPALEMLDQGIEAHPDALTLYKLRGDILATSRAWSPWPSLRSG